MAMRMGRIAGLACSVVGLAGCTIENPAYEAGADGESNGAGSPGSSSTRDAADGEPEPGTSQGSGETTGGKGGSSDEAGTTTNETGATEETGEPPDPPEPPQVGPFGEPVRVDISSLAADDDPTLPDDMLEIYFASTRPGGPGVDDIWVARREHVQDPWDMPELVPQLSSPTSDNTPEISADGLTMMLSSDREGGGIDIYMATRPDRESPWSTPLRVADLSTDMRDVCPFLTADGQHVYSCVGPGAMQDLLRFDRVKDGWAPPVPLRELNTSMAECGAWLDHSRRLILFVSDRPEGLGSVDLWMATRPSVDVPFEAPVVLPVVNSVVLDDDPWLSPDGGTLYFASTRPPTIGIDIYVAYRVRE